MARLQRPSLFAQFFNAFVEHGPEVRRERVKFERIVGREQLFKDLLNWIVH